MVLNILYLGGSNHLRALCILLSLRILYLLCESQVHNASSGLGPAIALYSLIIWLCLTRTGNYQIHEIDWLKWTLTTV